MEHWSTSTLPSPRPRSLPGCGLMVLPTSCGDGLYAVRLRDDTVLWHASELAGAATLDPYELHSTANVTATDEHVFYAYTRRLADAQVLVVGALKAETGRLLWQWRGSELPVPITGGASLVAVLGHLYVTAHEGMYAFAGNDGHLLWQHHPGYERRWAPVVIRTERAAG